MLASATPSLIDYLNRTSEHSSPLDVRAERSRQVLNGQDEKGRGRSRRVSDLGRVGVEGILFEEGGGESVW